VQGRTVADKGAEMEDLLLEYLPIIIFMGISGIIGLVLLVIPYFAAPSKPDAAKLSAYECGFNAFDDARMKFDVRFYLVAILFIIFDLEVAFLFPWAVSLGDVGMLGFWSMMVFLGVLTIGFTYEWKKGALEWE
jgi:NADH-quinone oxidoreductase subunit A